MSDCNITTRIMMAASHVYLEEIEKDIEERKKHPHKIPSPELGIDFEKIEHEIDIAKNRRFIKSLAIILISIIALFAFNYIYDPFITIAFYILTAGIVEYIEKTNKTNKIKKIISSDNILCEMDKNKLYAIIVSGGYSPAIPAKLKNVV